MIPAWLAPAILLGPLALAIVVALVPRHRAGLAHGLAAGGMATCLGLALWLAGTVVADNLYLRGPHLVWLDAGAFVLGLGTYVDPMGAIMAAIVCLLATLVLVYNAWYMHGDRLAARFPWQFCLFVFAMLTVVLADNLFMAFLGWELVGLGSYLLIGFWSHKPAASEDPEYQRGKGAGARGVLEDRLSPAHAQLKAFVMNRIGDAGFLVGIGALLAAGCAFGNGMREPLTWDALSLLAHGGVLSGSFLGLSGATLLTLAALGVFCGAIGKSAQFPLHTWLPDAMQGPTTASSIIHAATMVAAGVFLVARTYVLFTPDALVVVGWVGGITALLAASIACVQWDLKAVLAYSTVSQLGLMFVGLGAGEAAGGRAAAISHLFTHALFKCLLFLCAGAVIHACGGIQDLYRLGGLRRRMPITAACALLAVLAIIGTPLMSGFYSKDAVLDAAMNGAIHHHDGTGAAVLAWGPFALAAAASLLTGIYMLRWWIRIFAGRERDHAVTHHAHDPAGAATAVLLAMAPFCFATVWNAGGWLDTALASGVDRSGHSSLHAAGLLAGVGIIWAMAVTVAVYRWGDGGSGPAWRTLPGWLRALRLPCAELWGIDRLWDLLFVRGVGGVLARLTARVDLGSRERLATLEGAAPPRAADLASLDGLVDGIGRACGGLGRLGSVFQGGRIGAYLAAAVAIAAALLLLGLLA